MSNHNASFTQTTSVSWFGRLKRSIGGVLLGLVLLVACVIGLFWNEGRAVTTALSLAEGAGVVISVGAQDVDPVNEGKLVHVSGPVTTDARPSDPSFGIVADGIRLERRAEMFQWIETEKSETETQIGGGEETVTTYSYATGWSGRPVDSAGFKVSEGHANPPMEIRSETFQVPAAQIGAFRLDERVLDQIGGGKAMPLAAGQEPAIRDAFGGVKRLSVVDGRIYLGWNPTSPRVGDYRIGYDLVPPGIASIVARQEGSGFAPYQTEAGNQLLMVRTGGVDAAGMFADAMTSNTVLTWVLRIAGLVVLFIAFTLVMGPIGTIADIVPFLGSLVRMGTGLIAFVLAVLAGTVTIAVAWFFFRPLLSVIILAIGAAVVAGTVWYGRKRETGVEQGDAPAH